MYCLVYALSERVQAQAMGQVGAVGGSPEGPEGRPRGGPAHVGARPEIGPGIGLLIILMNNYITIDIRIMSSHRFSMLFYRF